MSEHVSSQECSLLVVDLSRPAAPTYSLEMAAAFADVHPEMLRYYCQLGLLGEERARPEADLIFDDDALYELRRFEHYRRNHGVDRKTLRLLCGLWREVDRLQTEVRFLRGR